MFFMPPRNYTKGNPRLQKEMKSTGEAVLFGVGDMKVHRLFRTQKPNKPAKETSA